MSYQKYSISKSSFIKFVQCSKAFFLYKNHPYLRDKLGIDKQLTFSRGHAIGEFAQQLFPGGKDISKLTKNLDEAIELTRNLIAGKTETIYEATFVYNGVLIMADILHFENDTYTAYEVKSSLKVSETYLLDACLQYYVLKNSLNNFTDLFLVTINGDYVLEDSINPKQLFKKRSVKKEAEKNLDYFRDKINEANLVLEQNAIPNINIGKHCFKPYQCDYFGTCWKNIHGEKSIFNVPMIGKDQLFEWNRAGINLIDEVDDSLIENKQILAVKRAFVSGEPIIKHEQIAELISKVNFPAAALDMEIWSSAIPAIKGTKPFQQIPFLFCIDDKINQTYFLTEHIIDERKIFAAELIEQTKSFKSLLVFDKTMEEQTINSLANLFEDLAGELNLLKSKIVDLSEIFKNLYYYESSFKNNFSLKTISEALKLDVSFDKIRSGLEAMKYYEKMREEKNQVEKQELTEDLKNYCFSDTRATFLLYQFLENLVKK